MIIVSYLLWKPNTWLCGAFQHCPSKCSNWNTYRSVMTTKCKLSISIGSCWTTTMTSTKHKHSIVMWIHMWCQSVQSYICFGNLPRGWVGTDAISLPKFHNNWALTVACGANDTGAMGQDLHGFTLVYYTFWNFGTVWVHVHWHSCCSKIPEQPAVDIGMWRRQSKDGQQHYFTYTGPS